MIEQRLDDRRRTRADVGAHFGRFDDVHGMTAAGDEHFGAELVVVVDLDDFTNQIHSVRSHVVEASDKRADEPGARFRGEKGLGRGEHERHVDADAFARKRLAGSDAVARERHFDDHVFVDRGDVVPLAHHPRKVGRGHLSADRSLDDVADFFQVLAELARLLGQQRRVRRDAVEDSQCRNRFDVPDAAGIDEELHKYS